MNDVETTIAKAERLAENLMAAAQEMKKTVQTLRHAIDTNADADRVESPWSERLLINNFDNLHKSHDNHFDVQDSAGNNYESRVIAKSGKVSLLPSWQLGKGRRYDETAYILKMKDMYGFIITVHPTPRYMIVCSLPSAMIINSSPVLRSINMRFLESAFNIRFDVIAQRLDKTSGEMVKL